NHGQAPGGAGRPAPDRQYGRSMAGRARQDAERVAAEVRGIRQEEAHPHGSAPRPDREGTTGSRQEDRGLPEQEVRSEWRALSEAERADEAGAEQDFQGPRGYREGRKLRLRV